MKPQSGQAHSGPESQISVRDALSRPKANRRRQGDIKVPALWIEEMAGPSPVPPIVQLAISWNPNEDPRRLKDGGVDLDELVSNFMEGFSIKKRRDKKNRDGFDLATARFSMRVGSIRGQKNGAPLARFVGCRRNEENGSPDLLRGQLTFEPVWEEVTCDLDQVVAVAIEASRKRRGHQRELSGATAKLAEVPKSMTDPLAGMARAQLGSLIILLNLFEKRHREQPGRSLPATVARPNAITDQTDKANPGASGDRRLQLLLKSDEDEFEPDRVVEFRIASGDGTNWERAKITRAEGRYLEIKPFESRELSADEQIEIRPFLRFDRKNHQIALKRFLEEDTIGHWPALVRLMASPSGLPPPKGEPPPKWFDPKLNDEQKRAVAGAINAPFAFFVQGPPGTGKSTVISEIVQHLTDRGERVLLVAPTHVAVDAVLKKIGDAPNIFAVRLARDEEDVSPDLRPFHERTVSEKLAKSVRCRENTESPAWRKQLAHCRTKQDQLCILRQAIEVRETAIKEQSAAQKQRDEWEVEAGLELSAARSALSNACEAVRRKKKELAEKNKLYQQLTSALDAAREKTIALKKEAHKFANGPLADATKKHDHAAGVLDRAESALRRIRNDFQNKKQILENTLKQEKAWQEKHGRLDAAVKQALKNVKTLSLEIPNRVRAAEEAREIHSKAQAQSGFWANVGNWFGLGPLARARKTHKQAEAALRDFENRLQLGKQAQAEAEKLFQQNDVEWRSWRAGAGGSNTITIKFRGNCPKCDQRLLTPASRGNLTLCCPTCKAEFEFVPPLAIDANNIFENDIPLQEIIAELDKEVQENEAVCAEKGEIAAQCVRHLEQIRAEWSRLEKAAADFESGHLANAEKEFQAAESTRELAQASKKQAEQDLSCRRKEWKQLLCNQSASRTANDELLKKRAAEVHGTQQAWEKAAREVRDGITLSADDIASRLDALAAEEQQVGRWLELEEEWLQATSEIPKGEIGRQLLRSANLICATTVAIGSSRIEGDWSDFDTLIVDEASRVTDGEFLIGAVRSRRWILVGDEHQLPPYVEQDEEHFLHALVALRMVEQGVSLDVKTAVEQLETWWEEDEELRQFRRDSVLRQVGELLAVDSSDQASNLVEEIERTRVENQYEAGPWKRTYRDSIEAIARSIEPNPDEEPHRHLMRLMIQFMVRSLFERCLEALGPESKLCQKLVVQRRMLGSIAELVRMPIYAGNYTSPVHDDLRRHGLSPLGFAKPFDGDLVFLDTSLQKAPWQRQSGSGFVNLLEGEWIIKACRQLNDELVRRGEQTPATVTILCFYQAQVKWIRDRIFKEQRRKPFRLLNLFEKERARVVPIDRIQGQESDIVFISFVRTYQHALLKNPPAGFALWLQDYRRLNVACTRAHRMLVLVGHLKTLEQMAQKSGLEKARGFYENLFDLLKHPTDGRGEQYRLVQHL